MSHFTDYLLSASWAMHEPDAQALRDAVAGFDEMKVDMHVLESYRAQSIRNAERAKARDGVGIMYIEGPLFKKANLMVEFCGATSYEIAMRDLQVLADDPTINSIALAVDSPGGEVNGCAELANAIFAMRGKKPITAYISGMGCSGAYWIASAADTIVMSETATVGSIGVVLGIRDSSEADAKRGVKTIEFVSSQSPYKRPDPTTKEGKDKIQATVNDMADVFISAVARNRGVSVETVLEKFGAGGVEVGKKAVALGMADKIGSFEGVISSLVTRGNKGRTQPRFGGITMSEQNTGPTAEEIAAQAKATATARIKGIMTAESGKALPALASHLAYDTDLSAEAAVKVMDAAKADLDAAKPAASSEPAPAPAPAAPQAPAADFTQRKADAGAIVGQPDAVGGNKDSETVAKGWGKAVANANSGLGL